MPLYYRVSNNTELICFCCFVIEDIVRYLMYLLPLSIFVLVVRMHHRTLPMCLFSPNVLYLSKLYQINMINIFLFLLAMYTHYYNLLVFICPCYYLPIMNDIFYSKNDAK